MLNPNASSRPPVTTYVPVGPNVVYEVEQEEQPRAGVTKRTKITTSSRDEAEDFGAPHDEREHATIKRAEQELEDVTADGLELGGFYAVIGGIAAASGHMDARRYYRYVGGGADMRTITSPVVKGARTRREFLANNRHLPKEWLNNVLALATREELVPAAAPPSSSLAPGGPVGGLDALRELEAKFETLFASFFNALRPVIVDKFNTIISKTEAETDIRKKHFSTFTTQMEDALNRQQEQQTELLDQMQRLITSLGNRQQKPKAKLSAGTGDVDNTEGMDAQLIGCNATAADKDILQRMLPNSQAEIDYFAAVMAGEAKNLTPSWVWATMTKPVFKFLLSATTWGGLEMVASELGRLPLFHGVPKDTVLLDLIASEDVRDVFCKFVSHTFTESNRETGRPESGKKGVAIFNSTSYKAMAAHSNWKLGAKLWFEHSVYYAPNPVTTDELRAEIDAITDEINQLEQRFSKMPFESFTSMVRTELARLKNYNDLSGFSVADWNSVISEIVQNINVSKQFEFQNTTALTAMLLKNSAFKKFRSQVTEWLKNYQLAGFLDTLIPNPVPEIDRDVDDGQLLAMWNEAPQSQFVRDVIASIPNNTNMFTEAGQDTFIAKARELLEYNWEIHENTAERKRNYLNDFQTDKTFKLLPIDHGILTRSSAKMRAEYDGFVATSLRRHFKAQQLEYLKKLLFTKQRELTCYRACVLKAM